MMSIMVQLNLLVSRLRQEGKIMLVCFSIWEYLPICNTHRVQQGQDGTYRNKSGTNLESFNFVYWANGNLYKIRHPLTLYFMVTLWFSTYQIKDLVFNDSEHLTLNLPLHWPYTDLCVVFHSVRGVTDRWHVLHNIRPRWSRTSQTSLERLSPSRGRNCISNWCCWQTQICRSESRIRCKNKQNKVPVIPWVLRLQLSLLKNRFFQKLWVFCRCCRDYGSTGFINTDGSFW